MTWVYLVKSWLINIEKKENQKYILQLKLQSNIERRKSNSKCDIYINDMNVMEMEEETKEYISTKPIRIVTIGIDLLLVSNNE